MADLRFCDAVGDVVLAAIGHQHQPIQKLILEELREIDFGLFFALIARGGGRHLDFDKLFLWQGE
ncbi:hypothetical protein D3C73_1463610 [compost metagenome]